MAEWKEVYLSKDYVVSNEDDVARLKDGLVLKQYPQKKWVCECLVAIALGQQIVPCA